MQKTRGIKMKARILEQIDTLINKYQKSYLAQLKHYDSLKLVNAEKTETGKIIRKLCLENLNKIKKLNLLYLSISESYN